MGLISRSGRSSGVGNGHPLQYSCLENSMDRGGWRTTAPGVTKIQIGLSARACTHTHTHTHTHTERLFNLGDLFNKNNTKL